MEKKFNKINYDNEYIKNNKDRINFVMERGTKDRIKLGAAKLGMSSSQFVREAIEEKLYKTGIEKNIVVASEPERPGTKEN